MAADPWESQIIELKDMIASLNRTVESLRPAQSLDAAMVREEEHIKKEKILQEQIAYLTGKLFGSSSEKRNSQTEGQLGLFDEAEREADSIPEDSVEAETVTYTRKKKTTQKDKFSGIPVVKNLVDVPESERFCKVCGTPLEKIGEEFLRRELEFVPAKVRIVEYYSVTYGCSECKKFRTPQIVHGRDGRFHMIHGMASASTVAWVVYQKYMNSVPLYRQEKDWKLYGCDLSRATMANWVIQNAEEFFKPLCDYFRRHILGRPYAMADETPVQVLKCYPSFSTHPIFLKSCKIKQGSIYFNLMYSLTDYFIWSPVMLS